ncbi:hypothetical protein ACHAXA_011008 [Cyclostephanos tholiformis]|uniref:Uncharacterized protein n=1 Tax=Cyclostephanos tholiformis TaxID=382380 RepID=A0ABD3R3T8_9STRA
MDRPSHLVLEGRPLTEATRRRMGMHTTTINRDSRGSIMDRSSATKGSFDSGKWVGDTNETAHTASDRAKENPSNERKTKKTTLTKVGDCIVDGKTMSEQSDKRITYLDKKKGINQKRKFKNIAVG